MIRVSLIQVQSLYSLTPMDVTGLIDETQTFEVRLERENDQNQLIVSDVTMTLLDMDGALYQLLFGLKGTDLLRLELADDVSGLFFKGYVDRDLTVRDPINLKVKISAFSMARRFWDTAKTYLLENWIVPYIVLPYTLPAQYASLQDAMWGHLEEYCTAAQNVLAAAAAAKGVSLGTFAGKIRIRRNTIMHTLVGTSPGGGSASAPAPDWTNWDNLNTLYTLENNSLADILLAVAVYFNFVWDFDYVNETLLAAHRGDILRSLGDLTSKIMDDGKLELAFSNNRRYDYLCSYFTPFTDVPSPRLLATVYSGMMKLDFSGPGIIAGQYEYVMTAVYNDATESGISGILAVTTDGLANWVTSSGIIQDTNIPSCATVTLDLGSCAGQVVSRNLYRKALGQAANYYSSQWMLVASIPGNADVTYVDKEAPLAFTQRAAAAQSSGLSLLMSQAVLDGRQEYIRFDTDAGVWASPIVGNAPPGNILTIEPDLRFKDPTKMESGGTQAKPLDLYRFFGKDLIGDLRTNYVDLFRVHHRFTMTLDGTDYRPGDSFTIANRSEQWSQYYFVIVSAYIHPVTETTDIKADAYPLFQTVGVSHD